MPLGGNLVAALTLQPGSARYRRSLDVQVYRRGNPAEPVKGATVQLLAQMRYMDHGSFRQAAEPTGSGHYLLPLPFAMPGEWVLDLDVAAAGQRGAVQLNVDLFE